MMRGQTSTKTSSGEKMYSIGLDLPIGVTEIEIDLPGGLKRIFKKEAAGERNNNSEGQNADLSLSSVSPDDDYWLGEDTSDGSTFDFILDEDGNVHGSLVDLKDATISHFRVDVEGSPFVVITPSSEFPDEEDIIVEESSVLFSTKVEEEEDEHKLPYNRSLIIRETSPNSTEFLMGDYDDNRSKDRDSVSHHISTQLGRHQDRALAFDDSGKNLDVLVVWSRNSECRVSGLGRGCRITSTTEARMRAMIKLAVAETNSAY